MEFAEKFDKIIVKTPVKPERHLWLNTIAFSLVFFSILSIYLRVRRGYYDLYIINKVLASTSVSLIGISLVLSSICYFWNFADSKIIYRKHLGIIGFIYAVIHTIVSLFFLSDHFQFPDYFLAPDHVLTFLAGLVALTIFLFMTVISNNYAVHELGGQNWRKVLRYGGDFGFFL